MAPTRFEPVEVEHESADDDGLAGAYVERRSGWAEGDILRP